MLKLRRNSRPWIQLHTRQVPTPSRDCLGPIGLRPTVGLQHPLFQAHFGEWALVENFHVGTQNFQIWHYQKIKIEIKLEWNRIIEWNNWSSGSCPEKSNLIQFLVQFFLLNLCRFGSTLLEIQQFHPKLSFKYWYLIFFMKYD